MSARALTGQRKPAGWPAGALGTCQRLVLLLVVCLSQFPSVGAQDVRVQRFRPDLDLYPQYFSVAQGPDGMVYVGHENGVLRFDGNRWALIEVVSRGPVRALHRDAQGRIWVGGAECFGYLERRADGAERYVDLTPAFEGELAGATFGDILQIVELDGQLWFAAEQHLFALASDGRPLGLWFNPGRFGAIAAVRGALWVHWFERGILRLLKGEFASVPTGEAFADDDVAFIHELPDGRVLIYDWSPQLRLWDNGVVNSIDGLSYDDLAPLSALHVLERDKVAFGGTDGVLRVLDLRTKRFAHVPVTDNYISSIERGADGALLLIDDGGLLRLPWPAQWIEYGSKAGFTGSVMHILSADDELILSTDAGVFAAELADDGLPVVPFKRLPWETQDTWQVHDTPYGRLVADRAGVQHLVGGRLRLVGLEGVLPRLMITDRRDDRLVWVGAEMGLGALRYEGSEWRELASLRRPGLVVWSMVPTGEDDTVWLGTNRGLMQATLVEDNGASIVLSDALGEGLGLAYGNTPYAEVSETPTGIVVATDAGLYRWDGQAFIEDDIKGLRGLLVGEELPWFEVDSQGKLFAQSYRALYRLDNDNWAVTNLAELRAGPVEAFAHGREGALWLGGARLFHHRPHGEPSTLAQPLSVVGLERRDPGQTASESLAVNRPVALRGRSARVTARFGLTDLAQTEPARYRYRLQGEASDWSPWQREPQATLDLAVGEHALEVQARTGSGHVYEAAPVSLSLTPHPHDSDLVRIAIAGGAAVLLVLAAYANSRRKLHALAARNRLLDDIVRRRTEQLREANRLLTQQAQRDPLTGIGNRRMFDQRLSMLFERAHLERLTLSLLLIDVDHFKQYNDAWGHQAGDSLLRELAQTLAGLVRADCTVARYGGEEFAVVAPGSDRTAAAALARRLVSALPKALDGETVSIGVATFTAGVDASVDDMIARADEALYLAKHRGRNRFEQAA
ncbi:MAG: GGDEF domain-containing protein [Pseudomonadota bacterium]